MFNQRARLLYELLIEKNLDAFFITNPFNILYLTQFKGESEKEREVTSYLDASGITLFLPKLYQEEVKSLSLKAVIVEERDQLFIKASSLFPKGARVGFEANDLRVSEYQELKKYSKAKLVATKALIENLRIIKHKDEIQLVKKAVKITDMAFEKVRQKIKVGMTERQVARIIVEIMESAGADGPSFEPIVACRRAAAQPHYITSNKKVSKGILLIDAGARYRGYNADLTRTFYIGRPPKRFIDAYNLVLKAQQESLSTLKPGIPAEKPWRVAVSVLERRAKYFTHGLGHGIGLEVHEAPYLRKNREDELREGMLVTIEPGVYYPGWGGIRIEDFCLVTNTGSEVLSKTPKQLKDIII